MEAEINFTRVSNSYNELSSLKKIFNEARIVSGKKILNQCVKISKKYKDLKLSMSSKYPKVKNIIDIICSGLKRKNFSSAIDAYFDLNKMTYITGTDCNNLSGRTLLGDNAIL